MLAKDVAATTVNVRNPVTENMLLGGDTSHDGLGVTTKAIFEYIKTGFTLGYIVFKPKMSIWDRDIIRMYIEIPTFIFELFFAHSSSSKHDCWTQYHADEEKYWKELSSNRGHFYAGQFLYVCLQSSEFNASFNSSSCKSKVSYNTQVTYKLQ